MKTKTIITSILLLAVSALASYACDCNKAKNPEEETKQETACNCTPKCACADNTDKSEAPKVDEGTEEN